VLDDRGVLRDFRCVWREDESVRPPATTFNVLALCNFVDVTCIEFFMSIEHHQKHFFKGLLI